MKSLKIYFNETRNREKIFPSKRTVTMLFDTLVTMLFAYNIHVVLTLCKAIQTYKYIYIYRKRKKRWFIILNKRSETREIVCHTLSMFAIIIF